MGGNSALSVPHRAGLSSLLRRGAIVRKVTTPSAIVALNVARFTPLRYTAIRVRHRPLLAVSAAFAFTFATLVLAAAFAPLPLRKGAMKEMRD